MMTMSSATILSRFVGRMPVPSHVGCRAGECTCGIGGTVKADKLYISGALVRYCVHFSCLTGEENFNCAWVRTHQ